MNTCSLTIPNVIDAEIGRKCALRKLVTGNDKLKEDFYEGIKNILEISTDEFIAKLDEFIEMRGFTILSERPFVVLDGATNRYRVNVMYTIAM